jgi:hypothetical protein
MDATGRREDTKASRFGFRSARDDRRLRSLDTLKLGSSPHLSSSRLRVFLLHFRIPKRQAKTRMTRGAVSVLATTGT